MKTKEINIDLFAVAPGVWGMKDTFVNVFAILNPSDNTWVLVDAGLKWSAPKIMKMAEILFGSGSRPTAIVLTHGHFDHVGSVSRLAAGWNIPVYAHHLEMPYLTGVSSYPPPDPTVGGGLMTDLSFLYPKGPINIEDRVIAFPQEGRVPGLSEWKYIHTPGHSPGHVSLFRESDKVLISGDALVTTKQESALSVIFQTKKLSGPPKYFTCDWLSAAWSVEQLARLEPEVVASSHGRPMRGMSMRKSLHNLVRDFDKVAVPRHGRYVKQPAVTDDTGVVQLPVKNKDATASPILKVLGVSAAILITLMLFSGDKKSKRTKEYRRKRRDMDFSHLNLKKEANKVRKESESYKQPVKDEANKVKKEVESYRQPVKQQVGKALREAQRGIEKMEKPLKESYNDLKEPVKEGFEKLTDPLKKKLDKLRK